MRSVKGSQIQVEGSQIQQQNLIDCMSNITIHKFLFSAEVGLLNLNGKINSPIQCTWKRSGESANSSEVNMVEGKADFKGEVIQINVNMYFDKTAECFQEKKSSFVFTMKTPKGEKMAGTVYVDLSKMLNNKWEEHKDIFPLEKCPISGATVSLKITSTFLGVKSDDTKTVVSTLGNESIISVADKSAEMSDKKIEKKAEASKIEKKAEAPKKVNEKDQQILQLKETIKTLTNQKEALQKQLAVAKMSVKGDSLKQELLKSKQMQNRLEDEVNQLKKGNLDHEKELETLRKKMESVYSNLYKNLSAHLANE